MNTSIKIEIAAAFLALAAAVLSVCAQSPAWWADREVLNTNPPSDFAGVNQGQVKWLATQAAAEFARTSTNWPALPGATNIMAVATSFSPSNNFRAANLGQLKHVAAPFYSFLNQNGLTNAYPPGVSGPYPWSVSTPSQNDFALANIGQAKYLFSFASPKFLDTDQDGLLDIDEIHWVDGTIQNPGVPAWYQLSVNSNQWVTITPSTVLEDWQEKRDYHGLIIDGYIPLDLPWPIPFYASVYSNAYISVHGLVRFSAGNDYRNQSLPTYSPACPFIAPFWDDLALKTSSTVTLAMDGGTGQRRYALSWLNVARHDDPAASLNFQVVFIESNATILLNYGSLTGSMADGSSATIGMQYPPYASPYAVNSPALKTNLSLVFTPLYRTDPASRDSDHDGMPDGWEIAHGMNPLDPSDAGQDSDGDGLSNLQECRAGTAPRTSNTGLDSDQDAMPDVWEVLHDLKPFDPSDAGLDPDQDGLTNLQEYQHGGDPHDPDPDGDGLTDAEEIVLGTNPQASDTDGDGISDLLETKSFVITWNTPATYTVLTNLTGQGTCFDRALLDGKQIVADRWDNNIALLRNNGHIIVWGDNSCGQINVPPCVTSAVAVAISGAQIQALLADGHLVVWGDGPAVPDGMTNITAIAASSWNSLALRADGTVVEWGWSWSGMPGGLSNVAAIAASDYGNIALCSNGTVVAWTDDGELIPPPEGLSNVVAVAADGWAQFMALRRDGTMEGWGWDQNWDAFQLPTTLSNGVAIYGSNYSGFQYVTADNRLHGVGPVPDCPIAARFVSVTALGGVGYAIVNLGTSATRADSDGDGIADSLELAMGTDPADTHSWLPAVIRTQPSSQTNRLGQPLSFSVEAIGPGPLAFQWLRNGVPMAGETNSTLVFTPVLADHDAGYRVVVDGVLGIVTSAVAGINLYCAITASASPGCSITPAGTNWVPYGSSLAFTNTPDPHWWLVGTIVDGLTNPAVPPAVMSLSDITANHFVRLVADSTLSVSSVLTNGYTGLGDPDGDRFPSLHEAVRGADPLSRLSVPTGITTRVYLPVQAARTNLDLNAAVNLAVTRAVALGNVTSAVVQLQAGKAYALRDTATLTQGVDVLVICTNGQATLDLCGTNRIDAGGCRSLSLSGLTMVNAAFGPVFDNVWATEGCIQGTLSMRDCIISNCLARGGTGYWWGWWAHRSLLVGAGPLVNCVVVSNTVEPALPYCWLLEGGFSVVNSTLVGNRVAGGQLCSPGSTLLNSIVWGNSGVVAPSAQAAASCIEGGSLANGCITGNPCFTPGSWSLQVTSPCLSRAVAAGAPAYDINGTGRGAWVDLGAYENSEADQNNDQLPDAWEIRWAGSLTNLDSLADSDGDGLSNMQEYTQGTNPFNANSDGDSLSDRDEVQLHHTDPLKADTDGDGMPDGWEVARGLNPSSPSDALLDADSDGLTNLQEYQHGTNPNHSDTDGDGLADGWEVSHGFNPLYAALPGESEHVASDPDHDGLTNLAESQTGTDPRNADTDGDGLTDHDELQVHHTDPLKADTDGDGLSDGAEVKGVVLGYIPGGGLTVRALGDVAALAMGLDHGVALHSDGSVVALGQGAGAEDYLPPNLTNVAAIAVDPQGAYGLAVTSNGVLIGWGIDVPELPGRAIGVAAREGCCLALLEDGTVTAWGGGSWIGQYEVPEGLSNVVAVAARVGHSLALRADGTVVAWGANWCGQVDVPGLSDVVGIAVGFSHSLALRGDGTVTAWGQYVNRRADIPAGLPRMVRIGSSTEGALTLGEDGTVYMWGDWGYDNDVHAIHSLSNVTALANNMYGRVFFAGQLGTGPRNADTDGDGMLDGWEVHNGLNPLDAADAAMDLDLDGLSNLEESQLGTNPRIFDTDGGGIPDGWEVTHGLNPLQAGDDMAVGEDGRTNLQVYQNDDPSLDPSHPKPGTYNITIQMGETSGLPWGLPTWGRAHLKVGDREFRMNNALAGGNPINRTFSVAVGQRLEVRLMDTRPMDETAIWVTCRVWVNGQAAPAWMLNDPAGILSGGEIMMPFPPWLNATAKSCPADLKSLSGPSSASGGSAAGLDATLALPAVKICYAGTTDEIMGSVCLRGGGVSVDAVTFPLGTACELSWTNKVLEPEEWDWWTGDTHYDYVEILMGGLSSGVSDTVEVHRATDVSRHWEAPAGTNSHIMAHGSESWTGVIPINNDSDNGSDAEDLGKSPVADENDLDATSFHDDRCSSCNCYHSSAATGVVTVTSGLKLWNDDTKSAEGKAEIIGSGTRYLEGTELSSALGDREVRECCPDGSGDAITNRFTVMRLEVLADINHDDRVDANDLAAAKAQEASNGLKGLLMGSGINNLVRVDLRTYCNLTTGDLTLHTPDGVRLRSLDGSIFLEAGGTKVWHGPEIAALPEIKSLYAEGLLPGEHLVTYSYAGTNATGDWTTYSATLPVTIIKVDIVPDFNHDGVITDDDKSLLLANPPFHFWINDDDDNGNEASGDSDLPGHWSRGTSPADYSNGGVDGRCDLLDFFPVWLDLHDTQNLLPPSGTVQYKLRQANGAVKAVYTDLTKGQAGAYLTTAGNTYSSSFGQNSYEATTLEVTSSGVVLDNAFLDKIKNDATKGILMMEGAGSTTSPLVLEVWKDGTKICEKEMPLKLSGVEAMYRWINLRPSGGPASSTGEPANNPDALSNGKNVFFLHGFNVDANEARGWSAEMFKRLYQAGSRAKFWGMTWNGDVGLISGLHYQEDVANALVVASNFNAQVSGVSGDKIVLAHSLGNMVVSGAIQDYGLGVSKYFMLDAAVATECYDPTAFNDATTGNYMLHVDWSGYSNKTWCSKWFELFSSPDDQAKLTWRNRFPAVLSVAYNFYSSVDEIFEVYAGTPSAFSGGLFHLERRAWQKQEMFKGRGGLGGTDWAGWGFSSEYTMAEANAATPDNLRTNAVFRQEPTTMFSSNITVQAVNDIIAQGIPALSYAAGVTNISYPYPSRNYNANDHKPNGWGRSGLPYNDRWLHSDLKNMAYLYTYELFTELVARGGLQ